ncbi:MAG TPA: sialate O-acetylesterase, partial [Armatimonadota bacterium]
WFQGKRRLQITGGTRVWGPGPVIGQDWKTGQFQVVEALLNPKESRQLVLTPGMATPDELTTLAGIAIDVQVRGVVPAQMLAPVPAVDGDLTILSPREYQVFQRQTRLRGHIAVAGQAKMDCDKVEVRITGASLQGALSDKWQPVPLERVRRTFAVDLPTPSGGWYKVEFRAMKAGTAVAQAALEHVGVGEVFVGCGQSNSTSCGEPRQNTETGMVSTFSGGDWRIANDPQPGVRDSIDGGSFWPAFGDAMYRKYQVPIGVAVTGHGGAPVTNWSPGTPAFIWTMTRILELGPGGFRALLWHQGESNTGQDANYYFEKLSATIKASHAAAGWDFPWFVAQASYHNPTEASFPGVREGQKRLWDTGLALEGPDTDTLTGDYRAGIHFNAKGLKKHGEMWAEKVGVYLDKVLSD